MKVAAAEAIAAIVADDELREDYIIPSVFNRDVAPTVPRPLPASRGSGQATAEFEMPTPPASPASGSPADRSNRRPPTTVCCYMRVTMTGATGLIGPKLVRAWSRAATR